MPYPDTEPHWSDMHPNYLLLIQTWYEFSCYLIYNDLFVAYDYFFGISLICVNNNNLVSGI